MAIYVLKKTGDKGYGVFAARNIKKNEHIFHKDLTALKWYTLQEIEDNPTLDGDHVDYVGYGKYAIDDSPFSYLNHACEPTYYCKMRSIAVKDIYALRDIKEGEELTHDYTATAVDQFAGNGFWVLDCKCGREKCRGQVTGDFLDLPEDLQRQYYANLAPSIKRIYRARFQDLFRTTRNSH